MTGYKIPKGFVEGYRNAIERYPKDSQYAWGMNAVVEALEVHPLEELDDTPWHTGTPTELGWYLLKIKSDDEMIYDTNQLIQSLWGLDWRYAHEEILGWQKIEEKQDGHTD